MKIKSGDKVAIITGKSKGKTGKVLQVFPALRRVSVEGINTAIKNVKPRKKGEKGQKIEFPAPLQLSNVRLVCPKCSKAVRVRYTFVERGGQRKKARACGACHELID